MISAWKTNMILVAESGKRDAGYGLPVTGCRSVAETLSLSKGGTFNDHPESRVPHLDARIPNQIDERENKHA